MSLGGGRSMALDLAVKNAIASGLAFAVAAGNSNGDACKSSPSAVEEAVTVGASTDQDGRAYFSNYGKCVDIFGPGHYISGAWIGGPSKEKTISGTSMASPHVCGVMALLLAEGDYTPAQLTTKLVELATKNVLTGVPSDTVNLLLNNGVF
jgi:cerevisin